MFDSIIQQNLRNECLNKVQFNEFNKNKVYISFNWLSEFEIKLFGIIGENAYEFNEFNKITI